MCGIAGVYGSENWEHSALLKQQHHRGPDATGTWGDNAVHLAHNRLAIIDLTNAGCQPMISLCGGYVMVYNGEIYNYRQLARQFALSPEASTNDSRVLIELFAKYGESILPSLIGMFAFAIYNQREKTLFLCRDRFGVKPLYYAFVNEVFVFASEIKLLFRAGVSRTPNHNVWAGYFKQNSFGAPYETFWKDVHQLPAGCTVSVHPRALDAKPKRWYHFTEAIHLQPAHSDGPDRLHEYHELLKEAIQFRFVSNVPVGVAASGGLDSSILLRTIHALFTSRKLEAFTFCTGHHLYDEVSWVKALLADTSLHLNEVLLNADEVPQLAAAMSAAQDEPYGGLPTLAYGKLFAYARSQGVYVLLDGQGLDEVWAGYDYYHNNSDAVIQGSSGGGTNEQVLSHEFMNLAVKQSIEQPFSHGLLNKQYRDLFYTKLPRALRFNDRASMMHSVELREPFLDHRLVEKGFSMPDQLKWNNGKTKYGLRQLAAAMMPAQISEAPKRPVQTPQREWLQHELNDWAGDHIQWLAQNNPYGWFHKEALLKNFDLFSIHGATNSNPIWQWINTALLLRGQ